MLKIMDGNDLMLKKIAVEATGLLEDHEVQSVLLASLNVENGYVKETAVKACRHIPSISKGLRAAIVKSVGALPPNELWRERKELLFSLSLSDSMRGVRRILVFRLCDLMWLFVTMTLIVIAALIIRTPIFIGFGICVIVATMAEVNNILRLLEECRRRT